MFGLLRTAGARVAPVLRGHTVTQRAGIRSKPAKEKVGPVETVIAISMFSLVTFGPYGWLLTHLEEYKNN